MTKKKRKIPVPQIAWTNAKLDAWWTKYVGDTFNWADTDAFFANITEFPHCCAFSIASGMKGEGLKPEYTRVKQGMTDFLLATGVLCFEVHTIHDPYVLVASASNQKIEEKVLAAVGFERIKAIVNPNTSRRVTLWLGKPSKR